MGTDVKSATLQLGKALEEPRIGLSMLRRSGISFTESQKQLIFSLSDTNQKAAAMSEVLTIIENQLGGVAARAAGEGGVTTVAGAFDELGRKFTLFQEELLGGTTLLRMFTSMVLKLADAIPVVDFSGMTDIDLKAFINNSNVELEQMNLHLALLKELAESDATGMFSGQLEKQMENIQKLTKKIQEAKDLLAERGEMKNVTVNTVPSGEGDFTLSKIFIDAKKKTDAFSLSQQSLAKQLGVTGADLELLKMKQAILNKAKLDGVVLTEKQIQMLDDLVEETREHAEALEQMQKVYGAFENAVNKAFSTVENSILGLIQGTETLKGVMKKMMQAFIADLTTSILKMLILDRLKKQVLGMIGASAGGGFGAVLGSIFGRQGGGSVSNNTPYMVGEKGPELFIPNSSGRVAPLDKAGFGAQTRGTTPIVVEQHINFTTGVQATVRSEVLNLLPQIQNSTIAAVQEARLRGGKFAESFGAR
jgi:hypothetical protein